MNVTNTDNRFAIGSLITARAHPYLKLQIVQYIDRIYYCSVVGNEDGNQLAYFERELIPPVSQGNMVAR